MTGTIAMVGTRKGLWIGTSPTTPGPAWSWTGPHFQMEEVYSVPIDRRGDRPRLFAGCSSSWFGPQVRRSDDLGETAEETPNGRSASPEDARQVLRRVRLRRRPRVWQLQPGVEDGVVWAGTEPGAIFRSTDRGELTSSADCGTTRTGRNGTRGSVVRPSTRSFPPRGRQLRARRHLDRGCLPHHGRGRVVGAGQPGREG